MSVVPPPAALEAPLLAGPDDEDMPAPAAAPLLAELLAAELLVAALLAAVLLDPAQPDNATAATTAEAHSTARERRRVKTVMPVMGTSFWEGNHWSVGWWQPSQKRRHRCYTTADCNGSYPKLQLMGGIGYSVPAAPGPPRLQPGALNPVP